MQSKPNQAQQSGPLNPEEAPRMIYRPKPRDLEESKTQDQADQHDVDQQPEVQHANPQSNTVPSGRLGSRQDVHQPKQRDVVSESAINTQNAFIKERNEQIQFAKAFQNVHFQGGEISDNVTIMLDRFDNSSENTIVSEFTQYPVTDMHINAFETFTRVDASSFNNDCPISKEEYSRHLGPVIVVGQAMRHVFTQPPERRAESEPFIQLQKADLFLPDSVNCVINTLGQVSTNAGKISLVPKSGVRQLLMAAIGLAIRTGVFQQETASLYVRDRLSVQSDDWNPMRVISNLMANNKDLVTSIMKDLQIPRTAPVETRSNPVPFVEGQPRLPPLVLSYDAQVYHDLNKNTLCNEIRTGLNQNDNTGEVIALRNDRENILRLQNCGYTITIDTPDEQLVLIAERIIAKWNTHIAPLNTKIIRSAVSKTGGGCAHQAIPMNSMQTKGHIIFDESDYAVAAAYPVCCKTFTYIDKYRHQGIKQSKMLDDYILQVMRK